MSLQPPPHCPDATAEPQPTIPCAPKHTLLCCLAAATTRGRYGGAKGFWFSNTFDSVINGFSTRGPPFMRDVHIGGISGGNAVVNGRGEDLALDLGGGVPSAAHANLFSNLTLGAVSVGAKGS